MTLPNPLIANVVPRAAPPKGQAAIQLSLFDTTGAAVVVPKVMPTLADDAALTSAVAAGATPTKAEYDALRVDVSNLRTVVNSLLAKARTAGLLAP